MVSMYHGVETGKRAISYFRKSMEIAGINTSKAKEEGYSRQQVAAKAAQALTTGKGYSMLGTGVEISAIERMRDQFLDARLRRSTVEESYWSTMLTGMERVDKIVMGSNDMSINTYLDNFWTSVQDVHKLPNEAAIRSFALEEADSLVQFVKTLSDDYRTYRDELNNDIRSMVEEANDLIDQIAVINRGINTLQNAGAGCNELLDKRDLLVDKLTMLTGAKTSVNELDMKDGDYKIDIDGKIVVQGTKVRHLMLVENNANRGYYDVQIEYDQYDISSDPSTVEVIVEQRADDTRESNGTCTMDALHNIEVVRTADEMYWQVGHASGETSERLMGLKPDTELGINGSFALSVGSAGVRVYSKIYSSDPPGKGEMLGPVSLDSQTKNYEFRISSGDFETTIALTWDKAAGNWSISDRAGNGPEVLGDTVSIDEIVDFINEKYPESDIVARNEDDALVLESSDRHMMSITDVSGDLMQTSGLANKNPIVKIDVTGEDTLQSVANKINNAYRFDKIVQIDGEGENATEKQLMLYDTVPAGVAPSSPDQWMHATVEQDDAGEWYLLLTSNVAGESHRINVLSGSVCGDVNDMTVARLLGLVSNGYEDPNSKISYDGQNDITSYVQVDARTKVVTDRYTLDGDVFVDDAYVILDGRKEYLSDANMFKEGREIATVGNAPTDTLSEFSPGLRVQVNGVGNSDIIVRHHLIEGKIYAAVKLRDDVLLSHQDVFDDMMYKLSTEFNAIHYAGYGTGDYADISGLGFFDPIKSKYGAFDKLRIDPEIISEDGFDHTRLAAMSGDGHGHVIGVGDGNNALAMAQLKQEKMFLGGTADFNDLYRDFVAQYASYAQHSKTMLKNQENITEKITNERSSIMDVNIDEEMLTLTQMNQHFNYTSRYLSTLMSVMDQIITGVGRVGL